MAQKIAQSDQHVHGGVVLLIANETDNVVESVEEKVWVQLHSQRIQLRLRELRFQTAGQKLALAILAIVIERVTDADHGAVNQQVRTERPVHARDEAWPE